MRLFISYAHTNHRKIRDLSALLEEMGHEAWFDEELNGGDDWWAGILRQIENCDVFIFALSKDSQRSEACHAEYQYALRLRKLVLPLRLEPVEMPDDLKMLHYEDVHGRKHHEITVTLARALNHLQRQVLTGTLEPQDSTPTRPKFPFPHDELADIRWQTRTLERLSPQELARLVFRLKQILRVEDPKAINEARQILYRMLKSPNLTLAVQEEIREALAIKRGPRKWHILGAAAALLLTILAVVMLLIGSQAESAELADGLVAGAYPEQEIQAKEVEETAPEPTNAPSNVNFEVVDPAQIEVGLVVNYGEDRPLTLHFDTPAETLWLFGLEFHWNDAAGNTQALRFNDFHYSAALPLHQFPAADCLQIAAPGIRADEDCTSVNTLFPFWIEQPLFSVWQGDRQIALCDTAIQRCQAIWTNQPDYTAGVELIAEWTDAEAIILRFETHQDSVNLSDLIFAIPLEQGGERLYRLSNFPDLGQNALFEITQVPADACIVIGANRDVQQPQDHRCTGGIFFDNHAVESTAGPFWAANIREFEIRYSNPALGASGDFRLGVCRPSGDRCRVRLDI